MCRKKNRPWAAGGERQKLWGPEGKTEGRGALRLPVGRRRRQLRAGIMEKNLHHQENKNDKGFSNRTLGR